MQKDIDWEPIERAAIAGVPYKLLSEQFGVPHGTILKRALRHQWPTPTRVAARAKELAVKSRAVATTVAEDWVQRGEDHRKTAFELAHASFKMMKPRKPKNWKDAEIIDKMARRAAGLENSENTQQVLVQLNESSDEQPIEHEIPVVDAHLVELPETSEQSERADSLPDHSLSSSPETQHPA